MKLSLCSKPRIREYLKYSFIAAIAYMTPVIFFLYNRSYQHLYYMYVGTALFMAVIFLYTVKLLSRPYDSQRATAMLIDGLIVTLVGIAFCWLALIIAFYLVFGNIFSYADMAKTLPHAPAAMEFHAAAGLLIRLMAITLLCNFGGGSFISIITSYAGKFNQAKDKPSGLKPSS